MKAMLGNLESLIAKLGEKEKLRNSAVVVVAIVLVAQMYFVRELLAAELLFGLGFAILLALGGLLYAIGAISERGLDWAEAGVRVVVDSARRGYASLEDITRKPFRHPRSESAQ